ncbi:MAG: O-linked N-acetylglucosamine transferase, SPINDLY family protein [Oscillatoria sp. SIO1A7]|nr:O-linked N-acetylglucosamine transferase, SPINDLY family protein [Oscillatoria sp. SIO1A7]
MSKTAPTFWQEQANEFLIQGDYSRAASLYEEAISTEPDVKSNYWHLGLLLLLQGQEEEAATTWLLGMMDGEPEEVELWTAELVRVLQAEAGRQESLADWSAAWLIRQHLREVAPAKINNLLRLTQLSIELERFSGDELADWGIVSLLEGEKDELDSGLLLQVLKNVLETMPLHPHSLKLAEACLVYFPDEPQSFILLSILLLAAIKVDSSTRQPGIAASFGELCAKIDGKNPEVLAHLASFYQNAGEFESGIEIAKQYYAIAPTIPIRIFANHLLMRGLMRAGGRWQEAVAAFNLHESLLLSAIEAPPDTIDRAEGSRLFNANFFAPYFQDEARKNREIQNQLARLGKANLLGYAGETAEKYRQGLVLRREKLGNKERPLKIGYLSNCLRRHSVGWLARWVFHHRDRDRFQVAGYFLKPEQQDALQEWYVGQVDRAFKSGDSLEIAEQIYQDEIDILVELDSITIDLSCEVVALKPAPVQVTWLGWDASGVPGIDYYIADRYVLPESAQEYYRETIWRLPNSYIAVDGFEVGVPTLRRDTLGIPSDAVIYFSSQVGYKRHRDTARLQIKIIKEVPNSYFLIKGFGDQESLKSFFLELAEEEGVDGDRLRFPPGVEMEATHRANLGIADVVLDTYPYNGATTTLETLWMCVPLVTRVGQQFASRNSYTMMKNVGVSEGIAWSDEEYIEWGVRLGKDAKLRQKISWQLRRSRQTSPLWNGKQFTRDMENAYEEMWRRYIEGL